MAKKSKKKKSKQKSEEVRWYKVLGVMAGTTAAHTIPMPDRGGAVSEANKLERRGFSVVLLNFEGCIEYYSPWFDFELCKSLAAVDPAAAIRLSARFTSEVDADESETGELRRVSVPANIFLDVVVKKGVTLEEALNDALDDWGIHSKHCIELNGPMGVADLAVYPAYTNDRDYFLYSEIRQHSAGHRPRK